MQLLLSQEIPDVRESDVLSDLKVLICVDVMPTVMPDLLCQTF